MPQNCSHAIVYSTGIAAHI